jgi:hypothetical protein
MAPSPYSHRPTKPSPSCRGTVEDLLKPENKDKLVAVLTYHVVPGKVMSGDIAGKKSDVATVQGGEIAVDATDGVKVDDATVVTADIEASTTASSTSSTRSFCRSPDPSLRPPPRNRVRARGAVSTRPRLFRGQFAKPS